MKKKVVVGMSGGVDSSVAAYLLKEQGYEVIGVTIRLWESEGETAEKDAGIVAEMLGIPHYVCDFKSQFNKNVIDYFIGEYMQCRTPNPCIVCNRRVKWESLLSRAKDFGAEYVATGHYARLERLPNGRFTVQQSPTAHKDQTYALCMLTQEQLSHTLMPVGGYEKSEIRSLAQQAGLPVADKRDSQDICFVPDGGYAAFIERQTGGVSAAGNFVDEEGNVLGRHRGLVHYTIGQRRGLGISAEEPLFVKELRPEMNEVVLCCAEHLLSDVCFVEAVNYMAVPVLEKPVRALGKIRYSHAGALCTLFPQGDGTLRCQFDEPQRAITPGQSAVFYEDNYVLCGGVIAG